MIGYLRVSYQARHIVQDKVKEITANVTKSENELSEAKVSLHAIIKEKEIFSTNTIQVKECHEEVRRLSFQGAEKAAVVQHRKSLSETQLQDLDVVQDEILPSALQTKSNETFTGIIAESELRNIARASLEDKHAFTSVVERMQEKLHQLQLSLDEKQEALQGSEHVEF